MEYIKCSTCGRPKIRATSYNKLKSLADQPLFCSTKCRNADKSSVTAKCDGCGNKFTSVKNRADITYAVRNNKPVFCSTACSHPFRYKCSGCGKRVVATAKNYSYIRNRIKSRKSVNCSDCANSRGDGIPEKQLIELAEKNGFVLKPLKKKKGHKSPTRRGELHKGSKLIMEAQLSIIGKYMMGYTAGFVAGLTKAIRKNRKTKTCKSSSVGKASLSKIKPKKRKLSIVRKNGKKRATRHA